MCRLGHLDGGPFVVACAHPECFFTVQNMDTAPFLPSFVLVYEMKGRKLLKSIEFPEKILSLQVVSDLLYASLSMSVQIIDVKSRSVLRTIERSSKDGFCYATPRFLAFTVDDKQGSVMITCAPDYAVIAAIQCHKDVVRSMSIYDDVLTTASHKGTIIRTFSIKTGTMINEFRRGFRKSVVISLDSNEAMTCVCSKTSLHIFPGVMSHIVVPLTVEPLICAILDGNIGLVGTDGVLSIYEVDGMSGSAKVITRHRVIDSAVADSSQIGSFL
jgi:hypothetical protein